MKRVITLIIVLVLFGALPRPGQATGLEDKPSLRAGLNFTPGLYYNSTLDPVYNGSAAFVAVSGRYGPFLLGAGVETGYSYSGLHVLFPLEAGLSLAGRESSLELSSHAAVMPGLMLNRPAPFFLMAVELSLRLGWAVGPRFGLSLSAGPRYTVSPAYGGDVAPLSLLDLTIGCAAEFGPGGR